MFWCGVFWFVCLFFTFKSLSHLDLIQGPGGRKAEFYHSPDDSRSSYGNVHHVTGRLGQVLNFHMHLGELGDFLSCFPVCLPLHVSAPYFADCGDFAVGS